MGAQVQSLIEALQTSLAQTLDTLAVLAEPELEALSDHPCAMGGTVRDLLTHNIDHERMHIGQIYSARYALRLMQKDQADRLLAETLRARTELIAALIGLPDDALDRRLPDDDWTIREMVEHTLYWERHSITHLAQTQLRGRAPQGGPQLTRQPVDPVARPLAVDNPNGAG